MTISSRRPHWSLCCVRWAIQRFASPIRAMPRWLSRPTFHPSMVLLELDLLDISGYELARILRERAKSHDLRLIALTSSREQAGSERARSGGFERNLLLKPVGALDLVGLIAGAMGSP